MATLVFPHAEGKLISSLEEVLLQGIAAVRENDSPTLGRVMNEYADVLFRSGLEIEATHQDRLALESVPGVLGVKGTGALQADGVLILMRPKADRSEVLELARSRGLHLVSEGLSCQMGISGRGST